MEADFFFKSKPFLALGTGRLWSTNRYGCLATVSFNVLDLPIPMEERWHYRHFTTFFHLPRPKEPGITDGTTTIGSPRPKEPGRWYHTSGVVSVTWYGDGCDLGEPLVQ